MYVLSYYLSTQSFDDNNDRYYKMIPPQLDGTKNKERDEGEGALDI